MSNNHKEIITDDVSQDYNYMRQDRGGIVTEDSGLADRLLTNDKLYRSMKGDWERSDLNGGGFIKTTTGRKDGKFFITREQMNIKAIQAGVKKYREMAEAGIPDPLAPIGPDGELQWAWVSLPRVTAQMISDQYFGGMGWDLVKRDKTLKSQWYQVIQKECPEYICYPGGVLPIPFKAPYPARVGEKKFHKGI